MLIYRYMKNTQFAMLIAILGFFGMYASASAQILPASEYLNTKSHLLAPATTTNTTISFGNNPAITNAIIQANPVTSNPTITIVPANQNTTVLGSVITTAVPYPNANTINTNGITIAQQPIVPIEPVAPTPTPTPAPASNGGTGVVSVGQHTGGGMYGAPVVTTAPAAATYTAPVATTQTAPRVVYKTIYKEVPVKEQIPLLDETVSSFDDASTQNSDNAASVAGIGGFSLIGILAAIAVILVIMIAVQEYSARKRYEQAAQMHAHA